MINAIKKRNLGPAYFFMFLAFFAPTLVSPQPTEIRYVNLESYSPVVADRIALDSDPVLPANTEYLGQGGALEELIWGPFEEQEVVEESEPVIITRLNKLNYSNAIFPVNPIDISSHFGWREAPCEECSTDHHGVDFVPGHGADVVSILDGLVVEAGINGGFGTWVMIKHLVPSVEEEGEFEEWHTIYAHLQQDSIPDDVGVGSVVRKGQLIGLVGNTGVSTGSHLHFEILVDKEPVDPMPLMATYTQIELLEDGTERFIQYKQIWYNYLTMASRSYDIGSEPPQVTWTVVRGDTASFKAYVTDDARQPLNIPDWTIQMEIKRDGNLVMSTTPAADADDLEGEFTVTLTAAETRILETGDVFDIQLSLPQDAIVWTVAQGSMILIEDVTDRP